MKILVPVKRVVDYSIKVRPKPDGSAVDLDNLKMSMNPFDEIAVEAALQLREKGQATEVVVVTIGPAGAIDTLRAALAMGADRALHVPVDLPTEPLAVAKALAQIIARETPQLVIMGKQAIDDDSNQTGQMLAALLGWPQATFASSIVVEGTNVQVVREVDGGLETVQAPLPAVITTDLRLNQPRYASLPNIMKARQKPIETLQAADLGVDFTPRITITHVAEPPKRQAGVKVPDVATLLDKLRNEAKVI